MALLENPLEHPEKFHISKDLGFILEDPLEELPDRYQVWVKLAKNLPSLVEKGQFREEAEQLPELSIDQLQGYKEERLAHLALAVITMGYVWQDKNTKEVLPRNIAVPFWNLSEKLGLPPILVYADCVLANWKKKDPLGPMTYDNMDTLFSFPGGDCSKGFFLVSLLVEKAAASSMKAIADIFEAVKKKNSESLKESLQSVASSIYEAYETFQLVHEHVNPDDFFNILRVYLAGWKNCSFLPKGLIYEGVSEIPKEFAGGSAAQSSIMQCFDALLGIQHTTENDEKSAKYLEEMRNYMPSPHKRFLEAVASQSSVRDFVSSSDDTELKKAYNDCVKALVYIRNYHLQVVNTYIISPSNKQDSEKGQKSSDDEVKGTGGTNLLIFLRSVRDTTKQALLEES
ncbi:indoleamine 2,3-dioxygenase 1-like [Antechinus flavipes]|uniref:indoleamine 2,3-dioxygenase 1-like n=1 Tax=Antechinus flavipes TaxID=38775 RepID=UPI002235C68C|nr:indoleamine 2,3-dioxygenase 1-like [Antechinus flavipes]